ncbi:MAG TPA: CoA transferase, partial [Acidimicrobiia bacterium]
PQAVENGYVRWIGYEDGSRLPVAAVPVAFGDATGIPAPATVSTPAPRHADHTDDVLLECGLTWDELIEHKEKGDIS